MTAADPGLDRLVAQGKPDFVGRAMLDCEGLNDPERLQLVGVAPLQALDIARAGAHVINKSAAATLADDQGQITLTEHPPLVGAMIGVALVNRGLERIAKGSLFGAPCNANALWSG